MKNTNNNSEINLIVILGATATGKTRLAVEIAKKFNGEIISADSRQVYRGMDIGTGKDLDEYRDIPYHLIDIFDPGYQFNVYEYQKLFYSSFEDITSRQKLPILTGGTGLYIQAVLDKYDFVDAPENPQLRAELNLLDDDDLIAKLMLYKDNLHNSSDTNDRERTIRAIEIAVAQKENQKRNNFPTLGPLIIGIKFDRKLLHERITARLKARISEGMIDEVKSLITSGVTNETLEYYGLEYRFASQLLQKKMTRNDMFQKLNSSIKRFAKQQENYFKRMEKQGHKIHWLNGDKDTLQEACKLISSHIS